MLVYSSFQQTVFWYLLVAVSALISSMSTDSRYYNEELVLPALSPPSWVFGVVWPVLYVLQAQASYWTQHEQGEWTTAHWLFLSFLVVSTAWSYTFFRLKSNLLALGVMLASSALAVLTCVCYFAIDTVSGWFLVPTAVWVVMATALMYFIWVKNSSRASSGAPPPSASSRSYSQPVRHTHHHHHQHGLGHTHRHIHSEKRDLNPWENTQKREMLV